MARVCHPLVAGGGFLCVSNIILFDQPLPTPFHEIIKVQRINADIRKAAFALRSPNTMAPP